MQERQQLEDERKRERKMQEQRIIRAELDVFNKARIAQRQKEIQESLDRDMKILNEFVKSEQEEKESKMRRRDNLRKEMQAYREHLVQAKEIEKQRQAEIETWYANEQERLWKVRTEKWRAEQIARDKLMQEVMRTRQEQLKEALERNRHALEQVRMEKAQIEAQVAQAQKEEHEKRVKVLHNKQSYSTTLRQQIESLDERRKEEKRQQEREHQAAMVF
ncbi:hypothetical protein EDD86DRAFT_6516 [Gorgonomyces haynaldii]|nr:hypothetical protein EDD86DRAFT_6516 [Gorgonomyces haynaldii]